MLKSTQTGHDWLYAVGENKLICGSDIFEVTIRATLDNQAMACLVTAGGSR